jgi:dehydrogenase/reductase SDR family member 12
MRRQPRIGQVHVHVHATHPGWADTAGVRNWMLVFRALTRPIIRTPEQGADAIVWLGGAPEAVAARRELWDHVAALAKRSQARPA